MTLIEMTNNLAEKIMKLEKDLHERLAIIPDKTHRTELTTLIYDEVKTFVEANWPGENNE